MAGGMSSNRCTCGSSAFVASPAAVHGGVAATRSVCAPNGGFVASPRRLLRSSARGEVPTRRGALSRDGVRSQMKSPFESSSVASPFDPSGGLSAKSKPASAAAQREQKHNEALTDWLREHGVYLFNRSSWGKAPHALLISNETTDEGEPCGRGFLAGRDIYQGEPLFEIPLELCMTRTKAVQSLKLAPEVNEYIALAIMLIDERRKGEQSFYAPYMNVLPVDEELNMMFRWSDEELDVLQGSPSIAACRSLRQKLRSEFEDTERAVFAPRRERFPEDVFTLGAWEWAFAVLFSRTVLFDPMNSDSQELALVPYADLLNHNPFSTAFIERHTRLLRRNRQYATVYTDRTYTKMDQVYATYGQKSNAELMILYGFVVDRNPYDSIDISISLSAEDELYERKAEYLASVNREERIDFPLYSDRCPVEMIEFLRFCVANEAELEEGVFNTYICKRNELQVADAVTDACREALSSYSTTLDEDNKLLADRRLYLSLPKNTRMAVKLRRSEKRILTRTVNDIERRRKNPRTLFE